MEMGEHFEDELNEELALLANQSNINSYAFDVDEYFKLNDEWIFQPNNRSVFVPLLGSV